MFQRWPRGARGAPSFILLALIALFLVPVAPGQRLALLAGRGGVPEALTDGWSWPEWKGGLLVSRLQLLTSPDPSPNVMAYRQDGSRALSARLWFPDAYRVWLRDVAVADDGARLAAVGTVESTRGQFAGFLALISSTGAVTRVVRTSPFEGRAVVFGGDGSIWVFGLQLAEDRNVHRTPDHSTLHRYDSEGNLLQQLLPRSGFDCPGWHPANRRSGRAYLLASADRVGVLTSPACPEWIELTLDGSVIRRQKLPFMPFVGDPSARPLRDRGKLLTGVAMTRDHNVYASFTDGEGRRLFRLNRAANAWEPVATETGGPEAAPPFSRLAGADGDCLVYENEARQLVWAKIVP